MISTSMNLSEIRYTISHNIHEIEQTSKIAVPLGVGLLAFRKESARIPIINGDKATPLDSIKYWTDKAILRISGRVTSLTVDVVFGDDMGINSATTANIMPNNN